MPAKKYQNGENKTRIYRIWAGMKSRCYNPRVPCFKHYGGKGIGVCRAWQDFLGFLAWANKSGYSDVLEIDRRDGDKNYCPSNCRWATRQQQVLNSSPRIERHKSPFKCVYKLRYGNRWRAYIRFNGKTISLGCYESAEKAARVYDAAAKKYYGEFARTNFS